MNLLELSKLDIKDLQKIDYKKLIEDLRKKPDVIVTIIVPLITVIFCTNYFLQRRSEIKNFKNQIYNLEKKITIIEAYNTVQQDLNKFLKDYPMTINDNELISLLTDFAMSRKVQIESIQPAQKYSTSLFNLSSFTLNISAKEYKDIWLFINDIEESYSAIRLESLNGFISPKSNQSRHHRNSLPMDPNELWINVRLGIAAISLKND